VTYCAEDESGEKAGFLVLISRILESSFRKEVANWTTMLL